MLCCPRAKLWARSPALKFQREFVSFWVCLFVCLFFFCIITNCFRLRSGGGSTLQRGAVISTGRLVKGGALPRMLGLS